MFVPEWQTGKKADAFREAASDAMLASFSESNRNPLQHKPIPSLKAD